MNKQEEKINDDLFPLLIKKDLLLNVNENIKDKNITEYNHNNHINCDFDEIKKRIEQKIEFYMMKEYNELLCFLEKNMNILLIEQENQFIKNEMLKQQIYYLENYLKNLINKK